MGMVIKCILACDTCVVERMASLADAWMHARANVQKCRNAEMQKCRASLLPPGEGARRADEGTGEASCSSAPSAVGLEWMEPEPCRAQSSIARYPYPHPNPSPGGRGASQASRARCPSSIGRRRPKGEFFNACTRQSRQRRRAYSGRNSSV
ncbi:hypothetical protein EIQ09_15385 [Xanthomonas campestris pv. campestris]